MILWNGETFKKQTAGINMTYCQVILLRKNYNQIVFERYYISTLPSIEGVPNKNHLK